MSDQPGAGAAPAAEQDTTVFLVDDHAVVRTGLATYLGTEPGMRVVGQAANATAEIKRRWPEVEVVAVTSFLEEGKIRAVLEAGAAGYLLKDADADDVVHAIRAAQRGEVHLDPAAAKALTASMRAPRRAAVAALTPRERDVVVLIARGGTNRQIGKHLGVTERTARTHVSNILSKLGLASRTQAAMWAVNEGLVDVAPAGGA